jgi:SAM-dependent methyltransferase
MPTEAQWLADTRTSYDTVAGNYADLVRDSLDDQPYMRAHFRLFADLVRASGGGPVADVGCGPGHITGFLRDCGLDAYGVDLSPEMVRIAGRDHPGVRFEVGSMTELAHTDLGGIVAWYSLIHVPDEEIVPVLDRFRRALRPGAPLLVGFHAGASSRLKTEGYGGHPMRVHVHKRTPARYAEWFEEAGLATEAQMTIGTGGVVFGHRPQIEEQ